MALACQSLLPLLLNAELGGLSGPFPLGQSRRKGTLRVPLTGLQDLQPRHRDRSGLSPSTSSQAGLDPLLGCPPGQLLTSGQEGPKLFTLASGACEPLS